MVGDKPTGRVGVKTRRPVGHLLHKISRQLIIQGAGQIGKGCNARYSAGLFGAQTA
jgi:hypothetical protein